MAHALTMCSEAVINDGAHDLVKPDLPSLPHSSLSHNIMSFGTVATDLYSISKGLS